MSGLVYRTDLALPSKKEKPLSSIKHLTLEMWFGVYFSEGFGESLVFYQAFFRALSAWCPSLARLSLLTKPDTFPAIRASLGELSFSVELLERPPPINTWVPVW